VIDGYKISFVVNRKITSEINVLFRVLNAPHCARPARFPLFKTCSDESIIVSKTDPLNCQVKYCNENCNRKVNVGFQNQDF